MGICAISLLEIAIRFSSRDHRLGRSADQILQNLEASPMFQVQPITYAIAAEVAALGSWLRDPADRTIVATARVHRLRLLSSDRRIIESKLVTVIP